MNYADIHLVYNRTSYNLPKVEAKPAPEPEPQETVVVVQDQALVQECRALEQRCRELEDRLVSTLDKPTHSNRMILEYAAGYAIGKWLGLY